MQRAVVAHEGGEYEVVTTGADSDLETSTRIARSMAGRWGMPVGNIRADRTIPVLPRDGEPRMAGVSDELLDTVDEKVRRISDECDTEARRILLENRDKLDATVEQLLAHETLDEPEVYAAAGLPRPLSDPLQVECARSACGQAQHQQPRRDAGVVLVSARVEGVGAVPHAEVVVVGQHHRRRIPQGDTLDLGWRVRHRGRHVEQR
jgi:hypothetical protein